jgi:hypothetical protein
MNRAAVIVMSVVIAGASRAEVDVCTQWPGGVIGAGGMVTWTKDASPYRVGCPLEIAALTIEPGVTVVFLGDHVFSVTGTLIARGKAEEPILFTSVDPATVTWKGILFDGTQPGSELVHCIVEYANTSGLRLLQSIQTIESCTFRKNASGWMAAPTAGYGGGIYAIIDSGDLVIGDCRFIENKSYYDAAGLYAKMGTGIVTVDGCVFWKNIANPNVDGGDRVGGGAEIIGSSIFKKCLFEGNETHSCAGTSQTKRAYGGGIYVQVGSTAIENCIFRGNVVHGGDCGNGNIYAGYGGAIYLSNGSLHIANCIITKNVSANGSVGSGLFVNSGTAHIINSTFAYNKTSAVHRGGGDVSLTNCIVYFNNGCVETGTCPCEQISPTATVTNSCVQCGFPGEGNHAFNPAFTDGPSLKLTSHSPCVDAGNPDPALDDGARPPALGTVRNDMGAYGGPGAAGWIPPLPFDLNGNGVLDSQDIANGTSRDCNANGIPDECEIAENPGLDLDRDGIIDTCPGRSVRLVLLRTVPVFTYAVDLTSDVAFGDGELAIGVDPTVLQIIAVRQAAGLLPGTTVYLNPENPAAGNLACADGTRAGVTIGWYNPESGTVLTEPGTYRIFEIDIDFREGAPAGTCSPVEFVFCLGSAADAPVTNIITDAQGHSLPLYTIDDPALPCEYFVRGDANGDGKHDISDPIVILVYLFAGALKPACPDAADADDNGEVEITDAIYLLEWRFGSGSRPASPYPTCGRDPTDDDLGLCVYRSCP